MTALLKLCGCFNYITPLWFSLLILECKYHKNSHTITMCRWHGEKRSGKLVIVLRKPSSKSSAGREQIFGRIAAFFVATGWASGGGEVLWKSHKTKLWSLQITSAAPSPSRPSQLGNCPPALSKCQLDRTQLWQQPHWQLCRWRWKRGGQCRECPEG